MSKPVYADYVNHMLRFYVRSRADERDTRPASFRSDRDRINWNACHRIYTQLLPAEQDVLDRVYLQNTLNLGEAIRAYCAETSSEQNAVWTLLQDVSYRIAKERGL